MACSGTAGVWDGQNFGNCCWEEQRWGLGVVPGVSQGGFPALGIFAVDLSGGTWVLPEHGGIPVDGFPHGWDPSWMDPPGWQCQANPCLLGLFLCSQGCSCLAGIAGSVATLLHDAVMNPAEGNSWVSG